MGRKSKPQDQTVVVIDDEEDAAAKIKLPSTSSSGPPANENDAKGTNTTATEPVISSTNGTGEVQKKEEEDGEDSTTKEGESKTDGPGPATLQPKKRKINAADLAMCTLAIAADVRTGLQETGYVREYEYDDIHEVVMDKLYPDADWGDDEDLLLN